MGTGHNVRGVQRGAAVRVRRSGMYRGYCTCFSLALERPQLQSLRCSADRQANPTTNNPASLKLCTANGLKHTHTAKDNTFRRPEAFHRITRKEWYARNRPEEPVKGSQEGHLGCRWCLRSLEALAQTSVEGANGSEGVHRCAGCDWAAYCSDECRVADWTLANGHQQSCDGRK